MFKKLFAAFIAAFLCSTAFAQTSGCPMPNDRTQIKYGVTIDGAWAYWFCNPEHTAYAYRVATFDAINTDMLAAFKKCAAGDCKDAGVLAAATPAIKFPLNDPRLLAVYTNMRTAADVEIDYRVTMDGWIVSKNGTSATRPSYAYVNGVQAAKSKTTVPVGSPCDCNAVMLMKGGTTYCQTSPAFVAVCTKPKS